MKCAHMFWIAYDGVVAALPSNLCRNRSTAGPARLTFTRATMRYHALERRRTHRFNQPSRTPLSSTARPQPE